MIPTEAIAYFVVLILIGLTVPVAVSLIYVFTRKAQITSVLVGAAAFAVFAIGLESIPKALLLQIPSPVSTFLLGNAWALTIVGALLAGIFEETGRFVAFKFVLGKRTKRNTGMAYGLGHGLFEVMFLFVLTGIQNLTYVLLINSGQFDTVIAQVAATAPDQVAALEALPAQLASITFATLPLSLLERVGAVLFHIGASLLVFYGVRTRGKVWAYPLAILLHTLLDILAGLGQTGLITNVYVLEGIMLVFGTAVFLFGFLCFYRKMNDPLEPLGKTVTPVAPPMSGN